MMNIDYLIEYLLNENPKIRLTGQAITDEEKFSLYRSLSNIRPARPISDEYIEKERAYLKEYVHKTKTITQVSEIECFDITHPTSSIRNKDKLALWQGDITSLEIGAIVNAANSQGLGCFVPCHSCIDNQINTYAGVGLRLECDEHMRTIDYNLETSKAFTTGAYNLPADHVIHTVGPIITGNVGKKEVLQLKDCYVNTLREAQINDIRSIAFCCISTGEFHFPKKEACEIAVRCVDDYLEDNREDFDRIVFNVYSREDYEIYDRFIREN